MFIVENLAVNGAYLSADIAAGATSISVRAVGNLGAGNAYLWDKNNPVGEIVNITGIVGTTITIAAPGTVGSYTITADAVITNVAGIPLGNIVEFDIPIPGRWCKIAYVKIVQYQAPAAPPAPAAGMDVSFFIAERSGVDESVPHNLIYTVYSRNINIAYGAGLQYGEALSPAIPYKDQDDPGEERTYALHCRLQNEGGGVISDFGVVIKLAEISEAV